MIDRLLDVPSVSHPQRSWTSFYKALRPIVYSELFRILPRPYEGLEDLWHDIFIRFVRDPSVLRSVMPEARETYIRVATRRHALNYLRSRKRQEAAVARIPGKTTPDSVALADAELDFERLLSRIDERDRQIVKWRVLDEVSIAAIARRAGLSYSATAVRIFRALLKAREALGKIDDVKV